MCPLSAGSEQSESQRGIGAAESAREIRGLSGADAARAASISPAYLSKLESDVVKKPSPPVLHRLSEALAVPYADLMRLIGYRVPGDDRGDQDAGARGMFVPFFASGTTST